MFQIVPGEVPVSKGVVSAKSLKSASKGAGSKLNHVSTWNFGTPKMVALKAFNK